MTRTTLAIEKIDSLEPYGFMVDKLTLAELNRHHRQLLLLSNAV